MCALSGSQGGTCTIKMALTWPSRTAAVYLPCPFSGSRSRECLLVGGLCSIAGPSSISESPSCKGVMFALPAAHPASSTEMRRVKATRVFKHTSLHICKLRFCLSASHPAPPHPPKNPDCNERFQISQVAKRRMWRAGTIHLVYLSSFIAVRSSRFSPITLLAVPLEGAQDSYS